MVRQRFDKYWLLLLSTASGIHKNDLRIRINNLAADLDLDLEGLLKGSK